MATFRIETLVAAAPARLFWASLDPATHADSMARHREVARSRTETLRLGDEVEFTARHFGLPWTMRSRIIAWEEERSFTDAQVRGPFRSFTHRHDFVREGSGCRMTDEVSYAAPFGPLGRLTDAVVLQRYLTRLIADRSQFLKDHVEGAPG